MANLQEELLNFYKFITDRKDVPEISLRHGVLFTDKRGTNQESPPQDCLDLQPLLDKIWELAPYHPHEHSESLDELEMEMIRIAVSLVFGHASGPGQLVANWAIADSIAMRTEHGVNLDEFIRFCGYDRELAIRMGKVAKVVSSENRDQRVNNLMAKIAPEGWPES